MNTRRGEVYFVGRNAISSIGTEQLAGRPYLIISPDVVGAHSNGVIGVPLTLQAKKKLPQHCEVLSPRGEFSTVLCEQIRYLDESRLSDYYFTITEDEMKVVERCLLEAVGISSSVLDKPNGYTDAPSKTQAELLAQKNAEILSLKKEIEKLKIQIESYLNVIKSFIIK